MIKIFLNKEQRKELERFRSQSSSENSEKSLMILLCSEGYSVPKISKMLKRDPHTVRKWVKRYISYGIEGLKRRYSLGRPKDKRLKLKVHLDEILKISPEKYGYQDLVWSIPLIVYDAKLRLKLIVSEDTVTRALKDLGYSYKRPSKTVPAKAPTKEEKAKKIQTITNEIKKISSKFKDNTEIYALDEAHFSTQPYIVRGWLKKGSVTE